MSPQFCYSSSLLIHWFDVILPNIPVLQLNYFCISGNVNKTKEQPEAKPQTPSRHVMRPTTRTTTTTATITTTAMRKNIPTEQPDIETTATHTGVFNPGTNHNETQTSPQSSSPQDGRATKEGNDHF